MRGGGGRNKVGECKAGRRRNIFFIIYLQCFPLKGWRPKRWKPIFMCVWPSFILNVL